MSKSFPPPEAAANSANAAECWKIAEEEGVRASLAVRMKDAMVAAAEKQFEDVVFNKMGYDLIITAIIHFLVWFILVGYLGGFLCAMIQFLLSEDSIRRQYEAKHIFCPFACGGKGDIINPGYEVWTTNLVVGAIAASYAAYLILGSGFTDFRNELVCYKSEESHDKATIVGTFYEDVVHSHFGSMEMQTAAILMTKAKFTARMKFNKKIAQAIKLSVEFDNTGSKTVALPYYETSDHAMKTSFQEKLDAKLPQPMAENKEKESSSSTGTDIAIPQRYMQDSLGIACALSSPESRQRRVQTIRIPRGCVFWITYLTVVFLCILVLYAIGRIFALIGLVSSMLSGECDTEYMIREHGCDLAWFFSPVPLGFHRPGHYFEIVFFVLSTIGVFVFWYFRWPTHYAFYDEGIVELNDTLACLGKWWPRKTKVVLYQDAVSAGPGKDKIYQPCYQVKSNVTYDVEIIDGKAPKITAKFNAAELMKYNVRLNGDDMEKVAAQVSSSEQRLTSSESGTQINSKM